MLPRALAVFLIVSSSCAAQAQSNKIDSRLVGTWHSEEIRCAADQECANTVNEAQLDIDKTGNFKWVLYRDLQKSDVCSYQISADTPDTLDYDQCSIPGDHSDTFKYRLSGNALILTGGESPQAVVPDAGKPNPNPRDVVTMRFKRGLLASDWRAPSPEACNTAPVPEWTGSAHQIASHWDLLWRLTGKNDAKRAIAERNRLLWDAVKAYRGKAPPIVLEAISYSIEGDVFDDYLLASRDRVEVVQHAEGIIEQLRTCTRQVPIIKLKVQDSSKLWRFARSAPSSRTPAYLVFPSDASDAENVPDSGPFIFPPL